MDRTTFGAWAIGLYVAYVLGGFFFIAPLRGGNIAFLYGIAPFVLIGLAIGIMTLAARLLKRLGH